MRRRGPWTCGRIGWVPRPDTLLALAAEESALVVMGAYGHSRLREWIFGGFTEDVLRGAAVPVLMMH